MISLLPEPDDWLELEPERPDPPEVDFDPQEPLVLYGPAGEILHRQWPSIGFVSDRR